MAGRLSPGAQPGHLLPGQVTSAPGKSLAPLLLCSQGLLLGWDPGILKSELKREEGGKGAAGGSSGATHMSSA